MADKTKDLDYEGTATGDGETTDEGSAAGMPVPAASATGTTSAGKHEPVNPDAMGAAAAVSVTEIPGDDSSAGPGEGTGGDVGSGPTGAVTPDDFGIEEAPDAETSGGESNDAAGEGKSGGAGALPMGIAAFIAGLITGVIAGWFAAR
jgi:hypothetical protein